MLSSQHLPVPLALLRDGSLQKPLPFPRIRHRVQRHLVRLSYPSPRVSIYGFGFLDTVGGATSITRRSCPALSPNASLTSMHGHPIEADIFYELIYIVCIGKEKHKTKILTQCERVGFVYHARCLSFQNKHKMNSIGTSCI
jgi:hypothetical protein